MKRLMNNRVGILVVFLVFAGALLYENFTPTRAIVWGTVSAVFAFFVIRSELRRDAAHT
ncbi:MAG: hypothetical protein GX610_18490 [Rhodococcus sp.]|nr:hypothetical protein [Rhodococcus sp. (in: high G+C Gram-positive bacteria)]